MLRDIKAALSPKEINSNRKSDPLKESKDGDKISQEEHQLAGKSEEKVADIAPITTTKKDVTDMTKYVISSWVKNTNSFRNLLNTSKGRDKCAQFIQYTASLYIACMRTSDDKEIYELVKQRKEPSVNRAKKLESNISNGRKIFRLLLWLNEISEIENLVKNKKMNPGLRILKIASTFCSFFYYIADNWVWLAGLEFTSPRIFKYKWKQIKNTFSLWKTILELIISVYNIILKR